MSEHPQSQPVSWNKFGQTVAELENAPSSATESKEMSLDERFNLITRNLEEVTKPELFKKIMAERHPRIYWGTATTGKPHLAYFVPMAKLGDFLRAGCEVTILLADLHATMDCQKTPWDLLAFRVEYYKEAITAMLLSIGVPIEKLEFVIGSTYQLEKNFTLDGMKLFAQCSVHDAQKAGAEVVKQTESPPLSNLIYPLYQWLDEEYLNCDAQFGGTDQRKIFISAEKYLPKLGYRCRSHLMNKMVPGLTGGKMSASDEASKIDLLDTAKQVKKKINKVFCEEGNLENNPLMEWIENVIFIIRGQFVLEVRESDPVIYTDIADLKKDFGDKKIHPADLKSSMINVLNELLEPIRARFADDAHQKLITSGYPTKKAGGDGKKKKKEKKLGSKYPGAAENKGKKIKE